MLKRFMMGFVLGVCLMYWYIHRYQETVSDAEHWMGDSASSYRGDAHKRAADKVLNP